MLKPLVSIIIPTFNREKIIGETILSIINQNFSNWECIFIDDRSTDNTIDLIKKYCAKDTRFSFFNRPDEKAKGPSSCRNFGITKAKGDFIIFLDSDDLLASYCLSERIKAFEEFPKNDFLVFQMERFVKKPNNYLPFKLNELSTENCMSSFLQLTSVWQVTSPIYKKEFLLKINGFNEKKRLNSRQTVLFFLVHGFFII